MQRLYIWKKKICLQYKQRYNAYNNVNAVDSDTVNDDDDDIIEQRRERRWRNPNDGDGWVDVSGFTINCKFWMKLEIRRRKKADTILVNHSICITLFFL